MISDKELFKSAILEALSQKYEAELASCNEDASCSRAHYVKMSKITGIKLSDLTEKRVNVKKSFIALLIAAALLLAGCTAFIYRNEIRDFIEEFYETYIKVSYSDKQMDNDSYIREYYSLSYVPEGYELVSESKNTLWVIYKWETVAGEKLIFDQEVIDGVNYTLDLENGKIQVISCNGIDVYCLVDTDWYRYLWNDGMYALSLSSSKEIHKEELQKILDGIMVCE